MIGECDPNSYPLQKKVVCIICFLVVPHSRVLTKHSAHSASLQSAGSCQPYAKHDQPVHPPNTAVERFHPSYDSHYHIQRLRRSRRALFGSLSVIQSNRLKRLLQFSRVSHRVGTVTGRNDGPCDDTCLLVRSDVSCREFQHIAPFVRVLDGRAGDVFCATLRSYRPCEEVETGRK